MLVWLALASLPVIWLLAEAGRRLYGLARSRKRLEAELAITRAELVLARDRGPLPPHVPEDQAMLTAWVKGYIASLDDAGEAAEPGDYPAK